MKRNLLANGCVYDKLNNYLKNSNIKNIALGELCKTHKNNMNKSPITPTIGRVVIYVPVENSSETSNYAKEVPAVIVRTWEDTSYEHSEVNLRVLTDGPEVTWQTSVPYSETNEPRTWHWPAKV